MPTNEYIIFEAYCKQIKLTFKKELIASHLFNVKAGFRYDYSFYELTSDEKPSIIVEVDGGVFSGGRHTRGVGYVNDSIKKNIAIVNSIPVICFPAQHVKEHPVICAEIVRAALYGLEYDFTEYEKLIIRPKRKKKNARSKKS